MTDEQQWWFNTSTGQVEHGRQSHYTHLMGPYTSEQAARDALTTAAARTKAADDEDERWDGER